MFILFVLSFVILGRLLSTGELAIFAVAWVFEKLQHVRNNAWKMCWICEICRNMAVFRRIYIHNNTLLNYGPEKTRHFSVFRF